MVGALAQYFDGSRRFVAANWTSSDPQVLTIDGDALVPRSRGTATLTAVAEGFTASAMFTVEPNMAGTWAGTYIVDRCEAGSGTMLDLICNDTPGRDPGILPVGKAAPMTLQIQRNGNDLVANAQFGELRGVLNGTDRGQNLMTLKGDLTVNRTRLTFVHWDTRARTDLMDGFLGFEIRIEGVSSHALISAHLDNVTRR